MILFQSTWQVVPAKIEFSLDNICRCIELKLTPFYQGFDFKIKFGVKTYLLCFAKELFDTKLKFLIS